VEENKFAAAGNEEECGGARRRHMSFGFIRYSQSRNSRDPLIGELEERDHLSHFLSLSLSLFLRYSNNVNAVQCSTTVCDMVTAFSGESSPQCFFLLIHDTSPVFNPRSEDQPS